MLNASVMMLVDGRFPAGGHTNSAGVEAAVKVGDIHDDRSLGRFLEGRLATTGVVDAAFAAKVAGLSGAETGPDTLALIDSEYSARVPSPRLREASRRYGRQLLRAGSTVWDTPLVRSVGRIEGGPHQPIVLGALVAAAGGTATDAALVAMHHLSAAVTSAAIRLLGLDPLTVAATQALVGARIDQWTVDAARWAGSPAADLPANGGSLTDILAEDHGRWDARLFVT